MSLAYKEAEKGYLLNEVPVGAILVDNATNLVISSAYNQVIQWIGGIHIKDYFKKVAEFNSIAVFLQNGTIASFPRKTILGMDVISISELLKSKNCFFGPRTDEGGFDIQIRGARPEDNETEG